MSTLQKQISGFLLESQHWSADMLLAYQRSQCAQLLRHARENVPFYNTRLDPIFRTNGDIDWSRWQEIPIVVRADLKENGQAMMAKSLPEGHGPHYEAASSGSTAAPVTLRSTMLMLAAGTGAFNRACDWYGFSTGDRFCVAVGTNVLKTLDQAAWAVGDGESGNLAGNRQSTHLAVNLNWSAERILSLMEQHGSNCFSGFSMTIEDIATAQMARPTNVDLKFVVGVSTALSESARTLSRAAFNAPAFSAYSSKEAHKIAHECSVSRGLHVNSELMFLEILDACGNLCAPGVTGRVIVTPFFSTAQPLIRYEQGDLATWGEPCPCGRAHPVIARVDGRIRNQFHFTGGHRFLPAIGYETYRDVLKADKWQVAQTGPRDIEVRYISAATDDAIDFPALTRLYQSSFHRELNVTYRRVETMPLTAAGKFIDYVNEYEAQQN